ncbi:MAG TPA: hypothetical protein VGG27_03720 [Magnetospirillaceae bacterium]|jgi:cell division protein FtsL
MATINIQNLISQARKAPIALRVIAIVVAVDLLVLLYAFFALEDGVEDRFGKVAELKGQLSDAQQKVASRRKEIERLPELRKLYDTALSGGVLAQQDRVKFVGLAQDLAKSHQLVDFHFKLQPEVSAQLPASKYRLASTNVELTNSAIRAGDIFSFWDEFLVRSQAHYRVTKAVVERVALADVKDLTAKIKSGGSGTLLTADLSFQWESLRVPAEAGVAAKVPAPAAHPANTSSKPAQDSP